MKIFKGIVKILLNLFLTSFIFLLMFSFYSKTVFSDFLTNVLVKTFTTTIVTYEEVYKDIDNTNNSDLNELFDSSTFNELMQDEEVQELISKYIDQGLIDITSDDDSIDVDISGDLINFLKENKSVLEEKYGITITDEDIDSLKNNEEFNDLNTVYKESIKNTRTQISDTYKNYIKLYNFLVSGLFKIILVIFIIIDLIILSILEKSFYKWISLLGINLLSSGSMTVLLGTIISLIINNILKSLKLTYTFNFSNIIIVGVIAFISGFLLLVVYYIIDKIIKNKKMEDLYNEVSNYDD